MGGRKEGRDDVREERGGRRRGGKMGVGGGMKGRGGGELERGGLVGGVCVCPGMWGGGGGGA